MNKTQSLVRRWQLVAWKPIMHLMSLLWMTSRRTPTKLNRFIASRKSRWPCNACVVHALLARRDYKPRGSVLRASLRASLRALLREELSLSFSFSSWEFLTLYNHCMYSAANNVIGRIEKTIRFDNGNS